MSRFFPSISTVCLLSSILLIGCAARPVAGDSPIVLYETIADDAHPVFESVAKEAAESGSLPARVTFKPVDQSLTYFHLHLDFKVHDKGVSTTEEVWALTSTMLLTIYPSTCGRYELELTGDLFDKDGNRLKTWYLAEQDTAFLWLFHGKDCGSEQSEVSVRQIAASMLSDLYVRMSRAGIWSGKTPDPVTQFPLVYLEPSNARKLVERVTKTDEPFPNFTFDPKVGKTADRIVRIEYLFTRTEQSMGSIIGRGMGAIITLGLMSTCPPNEMAIYAEVADADGNVLREYRYARKTRASGATCAAPTDVSDPELASNLLRQLFQQIKKDNVMPRAQSPNGGASP